MNAKEAYEYALNRKAPFPEGEAVIATDAHNSLAYARYILKEAWPEGEAAIATSAEWSYEYARDVLQAPFPLGEKKISGIEVIHKKYRKLFPKKKKPTFFKY